MIVIIGASASGKTELAKTLKEKYNYKKCVTTTTRDKRTGEVSGKDYHFISKEEFIKKVENDEFVENALYNNNYYGIQKKDIKKNALVIVEPTGANELIKKLGKDVFVVLVKTRKTIRKTRMINRGDSLSSVINRLNSDRKLFKKKNINKVDLVVRNNKGSIDDLALFVIRMYENR